MTLQERAQFRLNEMVRPSRVPVGVRGLGQAAAGAVMFKDLNGNVITQIPCGQAYTFDVPGYSNVWLVVVKDGVTTFDSSYAVPMPAYTADCGTDPGHYEIVAREIGTGVEIGRATLDILPAPSLIPGISNTMLAVGAVGLFLLMRRKKA